MTNYGVFRDDFYNAAAILTEAAQATGPVATGTLAASQLAGARTNAVTVGGTSQTYTTDTAVNIIAQIQNAVATAYKSNVGGFASSLGAQPAIVWPNFFNFTWILEINTSATVTGVTLAAGAGVTLAAAGALSSTALGAASAANAKFVCQVTGPTSVTMTRVQ